MMKGLEGTKKGKTNQLKRRPRAAKDGALKKPLVPGFSNPLESIAELLLGWHLFDRIDDSTSRPASSRVTNNTSLTSESTKVTTVPNLSSNASHSSAKEESVPDTFSTLEHYKSIWTPLLIRELKADILQSAKDLSASSLNKSTGYVRLSEAEYTSNGIKRSASTKVNLAFYPYKDNKNLSSLSASNQKDANVNEDGVGDTSWNKPSNMDLLVISSEPITLPLDETDKSRNLLLTLQTTSAGQGLLNRSLWDTMKMSIQNHQRNAKERTMKGSVTVKRVNSTSSASLSSLTKTTSSIQGQRRAIQEISKSQMHHSGSNKNGSSAGLSRSSSQSEIVTQVNGCTSYLLHYAIISSLTSGWREFMALHALNQNAPLLPNILAQEREIEIDHETSTPEYHHSDFDEATMSLDAPSSQDHDYSNSMHQSILGLKDSTEQVSSIGTNGKLGQKRKRVSGEVEDCNSKTIVLADKIPGVSTVYMNWLKSRYNKSQLLAISKAATHPGFTLIQGPPGTGKTTTIIGILNTFHLRQYGHYYEEALDVILGAEGMNCRKSEKDPTPWLNMVSKLCRRKKPHMLVVAPSNVAVDNIMERIMDVGFIDGFTNRYNPAILRVGADKKNPRVRPVTLEGAIETEQLSTMSEDTRGKVLQAASYKMKELISLIFREQTILLNLQTAFKERPLPVGWEIKIEEESCLAYWVDHRHQQTFPTPPTSRDFYDVEDERVRKQTKAEQQAASSSSSSSSSSSITFSSADLIKKEAIDVDALNTDTNERYSSVVDLKDPIVARNLSEYTVRTLPDHLKFAQSITQHIEQLDRLHLFVTRCRARQNPEIYGGISDARQIIETSVIDEANVIFTTMNSSGHPCLEGSTFQVTVIDEAAQAVEMSTLIPLRRGSSSCIMVGDDKQLPATIFSDKNKRLKYSRSLFQRLITAGMPYIMLDTQYRMTPRLNEFPSKTFYNGLLNSGPNVSSEKYLPAYINTGTANFVPPPRLPTTGMQHPLQALPVAPAMLYPLMFLHVPNAESSTGSSKKNIAEANVCVNMLQIILSEACRLNRGKIGSIGIITPYSDQLTTLRKAFRQRGMVDGALLSKIIEQDNLEYVVDSNDCLDIQLNTVDGFQGKEKDIIIISCVRSNDESNIGFLTDERRMNVAITRARYGLFVVGNANTLKSNQLWMSFINHVEATRMVVDTTKGKCLHDSIKLMSNSNDNVANTGIGGNASVISRTAPMSTSMLTNIYTNGYDSAPTAMLNSMSTPGIIMNPPPGIVVNPSSSIVNPMPVTALHPPILQVPRHHDPNKSREAFPVNNINDHSVGKG